MISGAILIADVLELRRSRSSFSKDLKLLSAKMIIHIGIIQCMCYLCDRPFGCISNLFPCSCYIMIYSKMLYARVRLIDLW